MAEQQLQLILFLIGGARITNTDIIPAAYYSWMENLQQEIQDYFIVINSSLCYGLWVAPEIIYC
jgi:hypothetical protein